MAEISYDIVAKIINPDFQNGRLYWRQRAPDMFKTAKYTAERECIRWNSRYAGREAFRSVSGDGYLHGSIFGRDYRAHRVLWLLHTGQWPDQQIDHINGNSADNRIVNLRVVSQSENCKNQKIPTNNTSGTVGVCWDKRDRKWMANIMLSGHNKHLGYFTDIAEAIDARKAAEAEYGFHPNHGRAA